MALMKKKKKEKMKRARCDRSKTYFCNQPASDHPEHDWVITDAGYQKFLSQFTMLDVRDPDNFDMHTYNDHLAYGALECIHALFLDYE